MPHHLILTFATASLLGMAAACATTYHIDAAGGDDHASGTSPQRAWRSLAKANATELKPGDQLLFKAGERWTGQLRPRGSGSAEAPIRIGRYGDGPPPGIDGGGKHPDTVLLSNNEYIEVADLAVTNHGPRRAPWRTGVKVEADGTEKLRQIRLLRLHVSDVNGDLRKSHEGCGIFFEARGGNDTHFDGLLIEGCRVERTDRNGICQRGTGRARSLNVVIRGNVLEDIGGDGIKLWGTNGGLIERNIVRKARARCGKHEAAAGIWPFACDDTVIQFNEVSGTVGTLDGQAYDSDYQCRRTIFQYNYSFQNEGGFMLVCSPGNSFNEDTIVRYNISLHDGINSARVIHFGGAARRTHFHNNTIIIGPHQQLPMLLFTEWNDGNARDSTFTNNLFVVEPGGLASYKFGDSLGNHFARNVFAGRHEGLPAEVKVLADQPFSRTVKPRPGFDSLKDLEPASPGAIPRGVFVKENGGRDFFGTPIPADGPPTVGAIEFR